MKISIAIWTYSNTRSIYANKKTKEFSIDEHELPFSKKFLKNSVKIVKNWPDHIENPDKVDGVIYQITYGKGKHQRTITGNNKTPEDFGKLMSLIKEYTPKTNADKIMAELRNVEDIV